MPVPSQGHIGVTGFEPATFCSQSRRATKLRYTPLVLLVGVEPTTKQILSLPPLPIGLQEQILVLLVGIEPTTYRF